MGATSKIGTSKGKTSGPHGLMNHRYRPFSDSRGPQWPKMVAPKNVHKGSKLASGERSNKSKHRILYPRGLVILLRATPIVVHSSSGLRTTELLKVNII